jgi:hypothetical protein
MFAPRRSPTRTRVTSDRPTVQGLHGLDSRPAHEMVALLGDPTTVDLGVGLPMAGGHPGPGAQLLRPGEPGHVADLGDEHRGQHGADAVDGLDRPEAGMGLQLRAGAFGQHVDLESERIDQPPQS